MCLNGTRVSSFNDRSADRKNVMIDIIAFTSAPSTQSRVYESVVSTILLYGCGTWPLHVKHQRISFRQRLPPLYPRSSAAGRCPMRCSALSPSPPRPSPNAHAIPAPMVRTCCSPSRGRNHPRCHQSGAAYALAPEARWPVVTWLSTLKEELTRMSNPNVCGLRR